MHFKNLENNFFNSALEVIIYILIFTSFFEGFF